MNILEAIDNLYESKRGSIKGRKKYTSKEGAKKEVTQAKKGRVKTYKSIKNALSQTYYGQIWSTKAAGRLYVTSKGKWGAKSGRGKIAKGFTKGSATPSAAFPSIKKHAARTMLRHGSGSDKLAKKYGSRTIRKKHGIGGKDGRLDKGK
jgi:hypothetical protein